MLALENGKTKPQGQLEVDFAPETNFTFSGCQLPGCQNNDGHPTGCTSESAAFVRADGGRTLPAGGRITPGSRRSVAISSSLGAVDYGMVSLLDSPRMGGTVYRNADCTSLFLAA
jgi:hypothetical protein